jgi:hypothetical protein
VTETASEELRLARGMVASRGRAKGSRDNPQDLVRALMAALSFGLLLAWWVALWICAAPIP